MTNSFRRFIEARLSREGVLGLHFTLGVVLLSLVTWLFADLAEDIPEGGALTITDVRFSNWLHAHASPALTKLLLVITHVHSTIGISLLTLIVCAYLWRRHVRREILGLLVTIYGGMLLNVWLKIIFHRTRPHFNDPLLIETNFSFPSGHTMAATVFYGVLAAIVLHRVRKWEWRLLTIVAAMFMIALVGFTRMYLGVHYLTDVIGAVFEGAAWLTVCLTAFETMKRRRGLRNIRNEES